MSSRQAERATRERYARIIEFCKEHGEVTGPEISRLFGKSKMGPTLWAMVSHKMLKVRVLDEIRDAQRKKARLYSLPEFDGVPRTSTRYGETEPFLLGQLWGGVNHGR